jgi:hypothetical protein
MKTNTQRVRTVKEAYQAIHEFFSCYHLHEALQDLERLFTWACKEKYYHKTAPMSIVFHTQQLQRLFSAAEILNYSTGKKISAIACTPDNSSPSSEFKLFLFAGKNPTWETFPRHLSLPEFINPYQALENLHSIPQWEHVLQEITEAALSKGSVEGYYTVGEVMKWKERMMGIVEGGWLLEMRGRENRAA